MNKMELLRHFNDRANHYLMDSQKFFASLNDRLKSNQRVDTDANLVKLKLDQIEIASMLLKEVMDITSLIIDSDTLSKYANAYESIAKSLIYLSTCTPEAEDGSEPYIEETLMLKIVKSSAESLKIARALKLT